MKRYSAALLAVLAGLTLACGGYSSKSTTPAVAGTMPTIEALAPNAMNSGGAAFVLTVNGSDFSSNATVNWNGAAKTTTYVSASQLTATIAAEDIATPATVPITVTNPAIAGMGAYGSGGTLAETSAPMNFTIN
ncbi:MAG: IPT/TIG domain-containing protein [Candidatus Sulfotelmatobacter sp.]